MSRYTQTNWTKDLLDSFERSLSQNDQNRSTNFPSIVFIDTKVADYHHLAASVIPETKVILIDPAQDGIEQITTTLRQIDQPSAIQIIAHGFPGGLSLGNSQLSLDTLEHYAPQLQSWAWGGRLKDFTEVIQANLAPPNTLFLYSCNVASGDAGAEFITKLHRLTGAEIAASANLTGSKALGGDWHLEVTTSSMNIPAVFTPEAIATYNHVLATGIDDLDANYINALPNEGDSYSVEGSGLNSGTIFNHNFRVGTENDLVLSSFSAGGEAYSLVGGFDQVNLNRVDNDNVAGNRQVLWFEYDNVDFVSHELDIKSSPINTMEEALLSNVINSGTDNILTNHDNIDDNQNNIERVDFVALNGLSAPTYQLDDYGFLIVERGGNDAFQVAPIINIDPQGNPTAFGSLVSVSAQDWGESSFVVETATAHQDKSDENLSYTTFLTEQTIAGLFLSYDDLGITGNQTFYGYAIFPTDISAGNDLIGLSDFPDTTTDSDTGLDLITSSLAVSQTPSQPPLIAGDDSANALSGIPVNIDVLDNDSGNPKIVNLSQPGNGTVEIDDNGTSDPSDDLIIYTSDPGFSGEDSFIYTVTNGNGSATTASVNVSVNPIQQVSPSGPDELLEERYLKFTLTQASAANLNEIGVYVVEDENGTVSGIAPGEEGYLEAVLTSGRVVFSALSGNPEPFAQNPSRIIDGFDEDSQLGFYMVSNSTTDQALHNLEAGLETPDVFFAHSEGNQDGFAHARITTIEENTYLYDWEDTWGGGDGDHNDLGFKVELTDSPQPLGSSIQGYAQHEIIDLTGVEGDMEAQFKNFSWASLDNIFGLYAIEDLSGSIIDPITGETLNPGDAGYTEAALDGSTVVDFAGNSNATTIIEGGSFYAPYLVTETGEVYFPFIEANADEMDHVRLLGDNVFGFEDASDTSDFDFDDFVVAVELSVI